MKTLFIFLALFVSHQTLADSANFTLVDNSTGTRYQCGPGGGSSDPNCVSTVGKVCESTGGWPSTCFNTASDQCKGAPVGFGDCVKSTTDYCIHTGGWASSCFSKSLEICKGTPHDLIEFIDKLKENAMLKELRKTEKEKRTP